MVEGLETGTGGLSWCQLGLAEGESGLVCLAKGVALLGKRSHLQTEEYRIEGEAMKLSANRLKFSELE